jgi:hypothetical protein
MFGFMLKDILEACLAFFIFPVILLFPGYVIGWGMDLWDFKRRKILTRYVIAVIISMSVVPILVYLPALFFSFYAAKLILAGFFILYIVLVAGEIKRSVANGTLSVTLAWYQKAAFLAAAGWILFATLSLVDLQWGDHLYNNAVSLDFATRVTMVNAVTRTGIPPVNPSFFPGHPVYITSLHYFWYILCSLADQLGGDWVDARAAVIAGDIWCGLGLMALVALYLKMRNRTNGDQSWKSAMVGISLLAISGLDIVPATVNMLTTRLSYGFTRPAGDIEHWNEQITAWVGSLLWVPHHIAALIACVTGFMLFQYYYKQNIHKKIPAMIVAGLSFASAVGLSTWVTLTFSLFLGVWAVILLAQKKDRELIPLMAFAGLVALLFAFPFILGILKGGTGASGGGLPFEFAVRKFLPAAPYAALLPAIPRNIIYFILLPVNYSMELGFFLFIGLLRLQQDRNSEMSNSPFFTPEKILLCVVVVVCSFVRSSIADNDLGWRGWLFGQFILLAWAVDLSSLFPLPLKYRDVNNVRSTPQNFKIKNFLAFFLIVGFLTTFEDVALLRVWSPFIDLGIAGFPNDLSPDMQLGQRTYASRLAYEFIDRELPADAIIQPNPFPIVGRRIDRPSGLYGSRQIAVSGNAPYNVPLPLLDMTKQQVSQIFVEHPGGWDQIDSLCREHFIDVLVVSDLDPLWNDLASLVPQREALYKNGYYAVFTCGKSNLALRDNGIIP